MEKRSVKKKDNLLFRSRKAWPWLLSTLTLGISLSTSVTFAQLKTNQYIKPQEGTLIIGQSIPLTGASAKLGKKYRAGAMAWLNHINQQGGIHGQKIELLSLDDQYEPQQTLANTKKLIQQPNLLALFGFIGTPTSKVVLPIIEQEKIPFIAPLTGASLLRDDNLKMVFNMRASYEREIQSIVSSLVRSARQRIAVIYQNDAFGEDGLNSTLTALKTHNLKPVTTAKVERNSADVRQAVRAIKDAKPNAVIIISAYVSSAAVSQALRDNNMNVQIMNVSFVGTGALEDALPPGQANGIGISQVVPFPWNRWIPVVARYQKLMRKADPNASYGFTSLEGFIAAQMLTIALEQAGKNPSREKLVEALESIRNRDLGGYSLNFSRDDHQGSDYVELTFLGAQRWEP